MKMNRVEEEVVTPSRSKHCAATACSSSLTLRVVLDRFQFGIQSMKGVNVGGWSAAQRRRAGIFRNK